MSPPVAFGTLPDGRTAHLVTLRQPGGLEARICTFGATLQSLLVPGRDGPADVVLGHDTLEGYLRRRDFLGATIGRVANRIAGGRFVLDGRDYAVPPNDGPNALHGGPAGLDRALWEIAALEASPHPALLLRHRSPDGEGGFPGTLDVSVRYALTAPDTLEIRFEARTDRPTVVSLTNHAFFHLGGGGGDVLGHRLRVAASRYLPVDDTLVPLGDPTPVEGTPFDFRRAHPLGERLRHPHPQLLRARGYDHNLCLDDVDGTPRPVAWLEDPASGRRMEMWSDQPGLQLYSGNFLDGSVAGKGGIPLRQSDAVCLEPQAWPDAPNRPAYPSARLDPGSTWRHRLLLRFGPA